MVHLALFWLLLVYSLAEYSPLELRGQEINIVCDWQSGLIELILPFENSTTFSTLACFAKAKKNITDQTECTLEVGSIYTCLNVLGSSSGTRLATFSMDIDIGRLKTDPRAAFVRKEGLSSPIIEVSHFESRVNLSQLLPQSSFFHMVSCEDYSDRKCNEDWKLNYVHTFVNIAYTQNLIVQRHHFCSFSKRPDGDLIYNHVFYGGTIRNKEKTMFVAVLAESKKTKINMWGGISYTNDHTNKDMFCFSNGNGEGHDMLSLLLGAPYKDIASNIGGEEDTVVIGNSYLAGSPFTQFFFIQYYRLYYTSDFVGDDWLFPKIDDRFAFAAYFHDGFEFPVECTNPDYQHQLMFFMPIDLSLCEHWIGLGWLFLSLLMLSL